MVRQCSIAPLVDHFGKGHSANSSGFGKFEERDTTPFFELLISK